MTFTYHARTVWQDSANPVTGPAPRQTARQGVAHWPGAPAIPRDIAQWLRAMQSDWTRNRGFSLGYWALVDQSGAAWQIRGPGPTPGVFNAAANPGRLVAGNANDWTAPILFAVTTAGEPASPAAVATARALWHRWGITARPVPHSTLDPTACCGPGIVRQINAGELDPAPAPGPGPGPTPQPDPNGETAMMIARRHGPGPEHTGYAWSGVDLAWLRDGNAAGPLLRGGTPSVDVSDVELSAIIASSATVGDPPPSLSTAQRSTWNANRR